LIFWVIGGNGPWLLVLLVYNTKPNFNNNIAIMTLVLDLHLKHVYNFNGWY